VGADEIENAAGSVVWVVRDGRCTAMEGIDFARLVEAFGRGGTKGASDRKGRSDAGLGAFRNG
jgi:hypothetical protein